LEDPGRGDPVPWERLSGFPAPFKLWETEFFPARSEDYREDYFDREIREGRLVWYGTGKEKGGFCEPDNLDLILPAGSTPAFSGKLSPEFFDIPKSFWEIKDALDAKNAGLGAVTEALWEEVWKGVLTADSWEPVRRALELGFVSPESSINSPVESGALSGDPPISAIGRRSLRLPRAIRERWRAGPPVRGNWFSLTYQGIADNDAGIIEPQSALGEDELNRARVRLLMKRYGLLCRPLLEHESPCFSWSRLLPAMRRMELAGELIAGRFFSGINSLQFASPGLTGELEAAEAERGIYWMNAADPASPVGSSIQSIITVRGEAPAPQIRRVPSSRLCFRGSELLALSNKNGKELEIFIPADDPDIVDALSFITSPKTRRVQPEQKISVEKINRVSAVRSEYSQVLDSLGFIKDRGKMVLW